MKRMAEQLKNQLRRSLKANSHVILVEQWNEGQQILGIYFREEDSVGIFMNLPEIENSQEESFMEAEQWLKNFRRLMEKEQLKRTPMLEDVKDQLLVGVVNQKWESGYNVSCRFLNLICIFFMIHEQTEYTAVRMVDEKWLNDWGITKEKLMEIAIENIHRFSSVMVPLEEVILEIVETELRSGEREDMLTELLAGIREQPSEVQIYLLASKSITFGANCILDKRILEKTAAVFQKDLILLPSSIYEFLVVPCNRENKEDQFLYLTDLLQHLNKEFKNEEEKLSDQLYYYERLTGELRMI